MFNSSRLDVFSLSAAEDRLSKWLFKKCPFCGSFDIGVEHQILEHLAGEGPCLARRQIWAYCKYCGASGPMRIADIISAKEETAVALESRNRRWFEDEVQED